MAKQYGDYDANEIKLFAALSAAIPNWRDHRFPAVFVALKRNGVSPRRQRVEELAATTLGEAFAPEPSVDEALHVSVDAATAQSVIESILQRTLAYDSEWVAPEQARAVASSFVACFADDADFWTNGELWRRDGAPRGWSPLTSATFDTGVVAVDDTSVGMLWVTDED